MVQVVCNQEISMRLKNFQENPELKKTKTSSPSGRRPVLGRGLDSLFSSPSVLSSTGGNSKREGFYLGIEKIQANPNQPRQIFDKEFLKELADSIKKNGLIQPVIVKKTGSKHQIVAGERRWRAAMQAGLKEIPVRILNSDNVFLPLVENLQREDLNPLELAVACKKLLQEQKLTQKQLADQLGIARPTLANYLRILSLPEEVQDLILKGKLSLALAKILLQEKDHLKQIKWASYFAKNKIGVREAQSLLSQEKKKPRKGTKKQILWQTQAMNQIQNVHGIKSRLSFRKKGGEFCLRYFSEPELKRIMDLLLKAKL